MLLIDHIQDPGVAFAKLINAPDLIHDEICIAEKKPTCLSCHAFFAFKLSFGNGQYIIIPIAPAELTQVFA